MPQKQTADDSLAPLDCARKLVLALLPATQFAPALNLESLHVIIGEGNWISYDCPFYPTTAKSLSALPLRARKKIAHALRPRTKKIQFRTRTRPSLHYSIASHEGLLTLTGHVDAAAPFHHPYIHLIHDYLPARGRGTHPTAHQLWSTYIATKQKNSSS